MKLFAPSTLPVWGSLLLHALACSRASPPVPNAGPSASVATAPPSASAAPHVQEEEAADASTEDAAAKRTRVERLPGAATEVREEEGKVIAVDAEGREAVLSATGLESSPALSPDGLRVLFLRRLPDAQDENRRDLYLMRLDGSPPELLLHDDGKRSVSGPESPKLTHFFHPEFFPDGKRATVSVAEGRGEAILSIDLQTKKVTWLASGFGYEHVLVPRGPHAGHLVLVKHLYSKDPAGGSYDECVLVDGKTGKVKEKLTGDALDCEDGPSLKERLGY